MDEQSSNNTLSNNTENLSSESSETASITTENSENDINIFNFTHLQETLEQWLVDLPVVIRRTIGTGFAALVYGGVVILLIQLSTITHRFISVIPQTPDFLAFGTGGLVLAALAMMGTPLLVAGIGGTATWLFFEGILYYFVQ